MGRLMCTMPCEARANVLMAQTRETTARWPCAKPARHLPKLNPDLPTTNYYYYYCRGRASRCLPVTQLDFFETAISSADLIAN